MTENLSWQTDAACAEIGDLDLFYPSKGGSNVDAKAVCSRCPVAAECLDYALAIEAGEQHGQWVGRFGIWGGLSAQERERLAKNHNQRNDRRTA